MKLRKLHIEDYKMFKDFDISFVDENDEPLPIIVLAGVNGSGKTTLLEYVFREFYYLDSKKRSFIEYEDKRKIFNTKVREKFNINALLFSKENKKDLTYFQSGIDDTKKVADEFVKSFYFYLKEKDYRPSEVKEHFYNYMQEIFNDLDLTFKYSHLDRDDNIWFANDNKEQFEINDLSTGEKTLLSKVMYLYFLDYKDKVILIDEPELSLHPSWQNKVLKIYENFAKKNNCQIIIATHSPHIIGSAKPEYIRLLKKEDDRIIAIENIDRSYGLEFDKILTDIMGVENLRTPAVAKDIQKLWDLLEDEEYESQEYIDLYNSLEKLLGGLDKDLVLARLEVARIKSENAKSK
jgi:predicted ATP-binding protein involved in virulence